MCLVYMLYGICGFRQPPVGAGHGGALQREGAADGAHRPSPGHDGVPGVLQAAGRLVGGPEVRPEVLKRLRVGCRLS